MKYLALSLLLISTAHAQVHQNGYFRQDGTYVAPTYRSAPNQTQTDNYGGLGNYNPYTGQKGEKKSHY
jgi:hypothetical protein